MDYHLTNFLPEKLADHEATEWVDALSSLTHRPNVRLDEVYFLLGEPVLGVELLINLRNRLRPVDIGVG